jgi:hypothetical protein
MNDEDAAFQAFLDEQAQEKAALAEVLRREKRVVAAVQNHSKALRKKVEGKKAELKANRQTLAAEEARLKELEATSRSADRIQQAKEALRRSRIAQLRKQRELEDLEAELSTVLTPQPRQPGADGILAYRRSLELESETATRKEEFDETMTLLDQAIGEKEEEIRAAEDYLDRALYLLGEECYSTRLKDPVLETFYRRLDGARR